MCSTKFDPMKPAPPVMSTFMACPLTERKMDAVSLLRPRLGSLPACRYGDAFPRERFFSDQIAGAPQRIECSGVGPPTIENFAAEQPVAQVRIIYVGDLQFAAPGGLERADAVKDRATVKIRADHGIRRTRRRRLLFDADQPVMIEHRNSESFRIGHFLQQDHGSACVGLKTLSRLFDAGLDDVVAENDADFLSLGKAFRQTQRVGNSSFTFLIRETYLLQPKILSVAEQPQKISGATASGDNQDVADSRVHQRLKRVVNHRFVIHRPHMLVRHPRYRINPSTCSSGENDSLHDFPPSAFKTRSPADNAMAQRSCATEPWRRNAFTGG